MVLPNYNYNDPFLAFIWLVGFLLSSGFGMFYAGILANNPEYQQNKIKWFITMSFVFAFVWPGFILIIPYMILFTAGRWCGRKFSNHKKEKAKKDRCNEIQSRNDPSNQ